MEVLGNTLEIPHFHNRRVHPLFRYFDIRSPFDTSQSVEFIKNYLATSPSVSDMYGNPAGGALPVGKGWHQDVDETGHLALITVLWSSQAPTLVADEHGNRIDNHLRAGDVILIENSREWHRSPDTWTGERWFARMYMFPQDPGYELVALAAIRSYFNKAG